MFGFLAVDENLPPDDEIDRFWEKCQHGSWYFLPWHRGYLSAFERILLAAIVDEGGPADWALPYWNYSDVNNPRAREIHPAFTSETMPDGSPNGLYTPYRFGTQPNGDLVIPEAGVSLKALTEVRFGAQVPMPGGFGGGKWPVSHSGNAGGELEGTPHADVHVAIGGTIFTQGRRVRGLMGAFETAGLDPVFWLHHANIDRLWDVWLARKPTHKNPDDPDWLGGPMDRPFLMPAVDGGEWQFASVDVIDTRAMPLDYVYDDISDPLASDGGVTESFAGPDGPVVADIDWKDRDTELIASSGAAIPISREGAHTDIAVPDTTLREASEKMTRESLAPEEVERFFLLLENIHGSDNAAIYEVYVDYGEPGQELPSGLPRAYMAGTFTTFGINARGTGDDVAPSGVSRLLDITPVIAQMGFDDVPDLSRLRVEIVPVTQAGEIEAPTIGRIDLYRETG